MTTKASSKKSEAKKGRSIYLDKSTDKKLVEIANETGTSIGNVVKELIDEKESKQKSTDQSLPQIIIFSNFKGGVSKTSSVREVAYNLSTDGYKVLLIDLDGQSNLSSSFKVYHPRNLPGYISDVILANSEGDRKGLEDVLIETEWQNVDLVAANLTFAAADNKIRSQEGGAIDRRLLYAIEDFIPEHPYDFILIDCPPTADSVVQNAILALQAGNSQSMVIIPLNPDVQAFDGMDITLQLIDTISQDNRLPKPKVKVLWTQAKTNTVLFKQLFEELKEDYPKLSVFMTVIPNSTKVGEARALQQPVTSYAKRSQPALRYRLLTEEILSGRESS